MTELSGIIPPLVLPLREDGRLDEPSLVSQVEHLVAAGVHGLWVNGTTGEFFGQGAETRRASIQCAAEAAAGRVPVIANVGANSIREAQHLGEQAKEAGAALLAAVTPYYLVQTQRELESYYSALSASANEGVFVYHLPEMTQNTLSIETMLSMAASGSVVGLKHSSGDLVWYRDLIRAAREREVSLSCFTGGGAVTDLGLMLGGAGAMPAIANLIPSTVIATYDACQRGDLACAMGIQSEVQELISALVLPGRATWAPTIAIFKYALVQLGQISSDHCDYLVEPLTPAERSSLDAAVQLIRDLEARYEGIAANRER